MTLALTAFQQVEYDNQVKAAYESSALLRGLCREKRNVKGSSVSFRRFGTGMARPHQSTHRAVPMGISGTPVPCSLMTWRASEFTGKDDQTLTTVDELPLLATVIGNAHGRREDQAKLDAMLASSATPIAHGGTGLTFDKVRLIRRYCKRNSIPLNRITLVIGADQEMTILGENKFTSRDFMGAFKMEDGNVTELLGMKVRVLDDRPEGGLSLSAGVRTCFAFDSMALGFASAIEERAVCEWDRDRYAWLSDQVARHGAVTIDPAGVLPVQCAES